MLKKRILNLTLAVIIVLAIVLFIVKPFQTSDLAAWEEEVSYQDYQVALSLLEDTIKDGRYTYFDFLEDITKNYTLPETSASLFSMQSTERNGYTGLDVASLGTEEVAKYQIDVPVSGYYEINTDYIVTGTILNNITISIGINDEYQYDDAKTIDVPLYWQDTTKEFSLDSYGDETLPGQVKIEEWRKLEFYNNTYTSTTPLLFYFEQGMNYITFENVSSGDLFIGDVYISAPTEIVGYSEYINQYTGQASEFSVFTNATQYIEKNSSYVRLLSFGNPSVTPFDSVDKKLNVIDGGAWYKSGQEVSYEVEVIESGLYDIAFHYANYKSDFQVFRSIKIDGEIPFIEFANYAFDYTPTNWKNEILSDEEGNPYQVYLDAGTHTITFRAEKEPVSQALRDIQLMIDHINQFALEIIKITGKDIDRDRTWKLTKYLPETESYLLAYNTIIKYMVVNLSEYSDKDDLSSSLSFLKKAVIEFEKMLKVPDELPLYLNNLYSGTSSITLMLGDSLTTLNNQQLFLDGFYVSNDQDYDRANATIFERFGSSVSSFFSSFVSDKYKVINEEDTINVWVNRPLTYVDIMQKMADSQFTEETGLKVKISVMPDANKLILANSAGNTPDIALGLASYMPFDLAIRGALYDLSEFDDFWLVANDFAPGAIVPYILEDGVYAIPETLEFNALVYRKDVFKSLGLEVPDTWDDVVGILPTLQRYDMNFYYPTSGGTALKWFYQTSPLIYQNGGSLYAEDGLSTTINSEESYQGLKFLGDLYTTYSLPEQVPLFFNSFRYNKLPVGIIDFNTYMQLKNAAPELVGQWALAPYPGIYNEETDSVERWYIGNGTGGAMFKNSDNPEGSWEFMKWWMSTEIQTEFAYTLQGTYGPEFLWLSGNLNAVESSPLDNDDKQIILEQIKWLRDVPRTPGQYMLERGLSNIWNTVTFDGTPMRVAIDKEVIIINREIRRKMIEFGYMDAEGNIIKPYIIRDVDWIQIQMDNALAGEN